MGAGVSQRENGPWLMEVDFPGRFSSPITPETFQDITESVRILTPPTPVFAAVAGGNPVGLIIKGAYPSRKIKLPVFEWTGLEQNINSPYPLNVEHYFALTNRFKVESLTTARVTIGKIALLDGFVACSMPLRESLFSIPKDKEISVISQPDVKESVAKAVFGILNGESQPTGTYSKLEYDYIHKRASAIRSNRQKVRQSIKRRITSN